MFFYIACCAALRIAPRKKEPGNYPFTLPMVMPEMKYRWKKG